ncbi:MAG: type II toxin-antitoxin system PemK/MazF family toxin [Acidobacteriota bacterium]
MVIRQGDIYWVELAEPSGSEPGYRHPHVVIQNNVFNASRISTVMTCALTSNLKLAQVGGNVLLRHAEGNLPKRRVVNVSQVYTVDSSRLLKRIGGLTGDRMREVIEGVRGVIEPKEPG